MCPFISARVLLNCFRLTMLFIHSNLMPKCPIDPIVYSSIKKIRYEHPIVVLLISSLHYQSRNICQVTACLGLSLMQCHNLRDPAIATASSPNFKQSFGFPLNTNQTQVLQSITAIDNSLLWISLFMSLVFRLVGTIILLYTSTCRQEFRREDDLGS